MSPGFGRGHAKTPGGVQVVGVGLHVLQRRAQELRSRTGRVRAREQPAGRHRSVQEQALRHRPALEQR